MYKKAECPVWGPEEIGSRANTVYGTDGDDTLNTMGNVANHDMNETFYGGAGDDDIRSEDGNDTTYENVIFGDKEDRIVFGEEIRVQYAYKYGDGRCLVEYMEFSDGLVYAIDYENLTLQLFIGE